MKAVPIFSGGFFFKYHKGHKDAALFSEGTKEELLLFYAAYDLCVKYSAFICANLCVNLREKETQGHKEAALFSEETKKSYNYFFASYVLCVKYSAFIRANICLNLREKETNSPHSYRGWRRCAFL